MSFFTGINNNSTENIRWLFSIIDKELPKDGTAFYPGCGSDLATLTIPSIKRHILLDEKIERWSEIIRHLEGLEDKRILRIDKVCSNKFYVKFFIDNKKKEILFMENYDKLKNYGLINLIYAWCPGSACLDSGFKETIINKMDSNGVIVASYSDEVRKYAHQALRVRSLDATLDILFKEDNNKSGLKIKPESFDIIPEYIGEAVRYHISGNYLYQGSFFNDKLYDWKKHKYLNIKELRLDWYYKKEKVLVLGKGHKINFA